MCLRHRACWGVSALRFRDLGVASGAVRRGVVVRVSQALGVAAERPQYTGLWAGQCCF